jgi:hypothetical protein
MIQRCARCGAPAAALMAFSYPDRAIWMDDLVVEVVPGTGHALCTLHADRLTPPVGWTLSDDRRGRMLFAPLEVA